MRYEDDAIRLKQMQQLLQGLQKITKKWRQHGTELHTKMVFRRSHLPDFFGAVDYTVDQWLDDGL